MPPIGFRRWNGSASLVCRSALFPLFALFVFVAGCSSTPPAPVNLYRQTAMTANIAAGRALARGDTTQALAQSERALSAAEALDDPALVGSILLNLARIDSQRGDLTGAQQRIDRILSAKPPPEPMLRAQAATRRALLLVDQGDPAGATSWLAQARSACAEPCSLRPTHDNLDAYLALQRNDLPAAFAAASAAEAAATSLRQDAEKANALRLQGQVATHDGRTDVAEQALQAALTLDRQLGFVDRIGLDLTLLAANERARGRAEAERDYLNRALTVYQASLNNAGVKTVRERLAALKPQ